MALFGTTPDPRYERYEKLRTVVSLGIDNFRRTGKALKEIRDSELWRLDSATWADCCKTHWKITPQHATRLIDAATFAEEVEPTGSVPQNENQVRALRALPVEDRAEAWSEAAKDGATPQAIRAAVEKRTPRRSNRPRPMRFRLPGAILIIEPNKRFHGVRETLDFAIQQLESKRDAA